MGCVWNVIFIFWGILARLGPSCGNLSRIRFRGIGTAGHERNLTVFRHLFLVLFFVGLTALEIAHGVFRLNTVRENQQRGITATIERGHNELARELQTRLQNASRHAGYLARLPLVRALLKGPPHDPKASKDLEAELLPYLLEWIEQINRVRVLDAEGREQFRCERHGQGVASIPRMLLDRQSDTAMVALTRDARAWEVLLSDLDVDVRRVEVPESDRQVINFATVVGEGEARLGILVVTVYAAPIFNSIRNFAPVPGVTSCLVADDGAYLASADRAREKGSPAASNLNKDYPAAAAEILSGAERVRTPDASFLALPAGKSSHPWHLVTCIPDAALVAASSDVRGQYAWVIGSIVVTTLVLIFVGASLVRMSVREFKLREAARYEKQQKAMERQIQMSERLGSLGLLTAGVAHEINNPLEGIENYLALMEREPVPAEKRKRYVEMIRYGFHRIRDIVRDLSTFSRPSVTGTSADIGGVARQALKMVAYAKEFKNVDVKLQGLDAPLIVPGDAGRLEQVFINLLLNSAKAMGGRGELTITARTPPARSGEEPRVEILVDDSGPGIPEDILGKIFDPFFTTTDGTGLGLSVSYGIVRAHGGSIVAQNREEGGARFTLSLPASQSVASSRIPEEHAS